MLGVKFFCGVVQTSSQSSVLIRLVVDPRNFVVRIAEVVLLGHVAASECRSVFHLYFDVFHCQDIVHDVAPVAARFVIVALRVVLPIFIVAVVLVHLVRMRR